MVAVILIGPPGAGKTTVGRILAQRNGSEFLDTDEMVEREQNRRIRDIFVEDGEAEFRRLETDAVRRAVAEHPGVLALGGGAPMQEPVREALAGRTVVFLDVAIADAARRIGFDRSRPLLGVNPRAQWTRIMEERRPTYARLASVVVDTAGREAEHVAEDVEAALGHGHG